MEGGWPGSLGKCERLCDPAGPLCRAVAAPNEEKLVELFQWKCKIFLQIEVLLQLMGVCRPSEMYIEPQNINVVKFQLGKSYQGINIWV